MVLELASQKQSTVLALIGRFGRRQIVRIRDFAQLVGTLISICPAIPYGWLHTKIFERAKMKALLQAANNYDAMMLLSASVHVEFSWWATHITGAHSPIRAYNFVVEIFTDASRSGWGASCGGERASGEWNAEELTWHINALELRAAFFGLLCFAKQISSAEILFRIDNTTAIWYINRMGGVQFSHLHNIACNIWNWCESRDNWVFASYISLYDNCEADAESRRSSPDTEWSLAEFAYMKIVKAFGDPKVDLFASRINRKCSVFYSWFRDPEATCVDAVYCFLATMQVLCVSPIFFNHTNLAKNKK